MNVIDEIFALFARHGGEDYTSDRVTQREHALQAAALAEASGAPPRQSLVLAALLHDVGHLLARPGDDLAGMYIDDAHEHVGADWLSPHFPAEVTEPIRLHVTAKRYLCAVEPGYIEELSPASVRSLTLQGGPLPARDVARFRASPHFEAALALRRLDERAKAPGRALPPLTAYRAHLEAALQLRTHRPHAAASGTGAGTGAGTGEAPEGRMTCRVGVNGFGRMGRLALRVAYGMPEITLTRINEIAGDPACHAHLLEFDSVHGRWPRRITAEADAIAIAGRPIRFSTGATPAETDWSDVDLVIECSGRFKTEQALHPYFEQGVETVLVSAPAPAPAVNIVRGVNDAAYDRSRHRIVTAASCTTNCLAPVVQVMHEGLGIVHGCATTIHSITNSQSLLDRGHRDLRRARAAGSSLIPTSTGSARTMTQLFPELEGKLNGLAVRVPLANASLVDLVFEAARPTTVEEVNALLRTAAHGRLEGILGYEDRPLVSVDYRGDPRSGIVDGLSTMVTDRRHVRFLAWYDNEWGYVNRMVELARRIARGLGEQR